MKKVYYVKKTGYLCYSYLICIEKTVDRLFFEVEDDTDEPAIAV